MSEKVLNIVCKQWTEDFEINGYHIEDILSLIKEAYGERAKEGISFATLNYSLDDFIAQRTDGDYWFLSFDSNRCLCGTARLTVKDNNSGEICNFAVFPQNQGKHVGAQLLQAANQFAKEHKLDYVMSYTAMKATSSVKCHCNNGYRIIAISIGLNKVYSSYVFRNQLSQSVIWNSTMLTKLRFLFSFLKYKLYKKPDGGNTCIGNFVFFLREHRTK